MFWVGQTRFGMLTGYGSGMDLGMELAPPHSSQDIRLDGCAWENEQVLYKRDGVSASIWLHTPHVPVNATRGRPAQTARPASAPSLGTMLGLPAENDQLNQVWSAYGVRIWCGFGYRPDPHQLQTRFRKRSSVRNAICSVDWSGNDLKVFPPNWVGIRSIINQSGVSGPPKLFLGARPSKFRLRCWWFLGLILGCFLVLTGTNMAPTFHKSPLKIHPKMHFILVQFVLDF